MCEKQLSIPCPGIRSLTIRNFWLKSMGNYTSDVMKWLCEPRNDHLEGTLKFNLRTAGKGFL